METGYLQLATSPKSQVDFQRIQYDDPKKAKEVRTFVDLTPNEKRVELLLQIGMVVLGTLLIIGAAAGVSVAVLYLNNPSTFFVLGIVFGIVGVAAGGAICIGLVATIDLESLKRGGGNRHTLEENFDTKLAAENIYTISLEELDEQINGTRTLNLASLYRQRMLTKDEFMLIKEQLKDYRTLKEQIVSKEKTLEQYHKTGKYSLTADSQDSEAYRYTRDHLDGLKDQMHKMRGDWEDLQKNLTIFTQKSS